LAEISQKILSYLDSLYGSGSPGKYSEFINQEPAQYLRVNLLKTNKEELINLLKDTYAVEAIDLPGMPFALKVTQGKEKVSKTIEHINGLYYMQGLSSMLPPLVLDAKPGETVLDLCSAPGSKTTEIGEMMLNSGTLVANEAALNRVKMLVYNIDRMNLVNAGVLHGKGELLSKIYFEYFDKVLVDAPCSGLGIIQKKEEVNDWWSVDKAEMLGDLQTRLLVAAVKMVKPGGEIVYSTCTLTPEENEFVVNTILKKYPVEIEAIKLPVPSRDGFTSFNGVELHPSLVYAGRVLPWEIDSDGFFIVKLRKTGECEKPGGSYINSRDLKLYPAGHKNTAGYLKNIPEDFGIPQDVLNEFKYIIKSNDLYFINSEWEDENPGMFERIGTKFGSVDRNSKINLHTQAAQVLEKYISKNIFNIDEQGDLKVYLDGGIIKKDPGFTGQCVVKYNNHLLGTAVVTGTGIKSRFPRAKRTQEIMKEF
jgi:16S rRNA (cytosine1407-C5)-methyltransferase